VAGEASGGVHGRNRLIGNSMLDYNVFGRRAGINAAAYIKSVRLGKLTLEYIQAYEKELKSAKLKTNLITQILHTSYTPEDVRKQTACYEGILR